MKLHRQLASTRPGPGCPPSLVSHGPEGRGTRRTRTGPAHCRARPRPPSGPGPGGPGPDRACRTAGPGAAGPGAAARWDSEGQCGLARRGPGPGLRLLDLRVLAARARADDSELELASEAQADSDPAGWRRACMMPRQVRAESPGRVTVTQPPGQRDADSGSRSPGDVSTISLRVNRDAGVAKKSRCQCNVC